MIANQTCVVLYDPANKIKIGSLISGEVANMLEQKGVESLPVKHNRISLNGVSGYAIRHYGSGLDIANTVAAIYCPLFLSVPSGINKLYWKVQLEKTEGKLGGFIRVVSNSGTSSSNSVSIGQSDSVELSDLSEESGLYTVKGSAILASPQEGLASIGLWCKTIGVKVHWFAASHTERLKQCDFPVKQVSSKVLHLMILVSTQQKFQIHCRVSRIHHRSITTL